MMVASFPRGGLSLGTGGALADTLAKAVLCLVNCSPKTTGHDVAVIVRRCQGSFRLGVNGPLADCYLVGRASTVGQASFADTLAKAVLCLVNCPPKTTGHDVAVVICPYLDIFCTRVIWLLPSGTPL